MNQQLYKHRMNIIKAIRNFFDSRDYLETQVPILSSMVIPESTIPLFSTTLEPAPWDQATEARELYLLPSPEYYMKQLLAQGWGNMYSLGPCFRNRESFSSQHNPEFTMLEYYTIQANYLDTLELTRELLANIPLNPRIPEARILHKPVRTLTMEQAFQELAGLSLEPAAAPPDTPEGNKWALEEIRSLAASKGIEFTDDEPWEDTFHRLFLTLVEPNLPFDQPLALLDYPWRVRTTACRKNSSPWAERWELYVQGLEIANVYTEEQDPLLCSLFLEEETRAMEAQGLRVKPDSRYPDIAANLPPCSGAALGVDRLVMVAAGARTIQEARLFCLRNLRA